VILAFGEIMARLAPPGHLRWRQALPGSVNVTWGGGEANVCASLALFGEQVRYLTALPRTPITESIESTLRGLGVQTDYVLWRKVGRLGLYFVETGANQRGSTVIYDRDQSAISLAGPEEYNFAAALDGVTSLHITGITPAISESAFRATLALVTLAREYDVTVYCDLNFRKKLWNWRQGTTAKDLARDCMSRILPHVNVVIANEEDAGDVLGIHATGSDASAGKIDPAAYTSVAQQIVERFPSVSRVAITLRESVSADRNHWGAMLYDAPRKQSFFAPLGEHGRYQPYEISDIVDRVGAGDSFAAGLIYALRSKDYASDMQQALGFAVAASCLKHSIQGDFNYITREEVEALLKGNQSGRVQR